MIILEFVNTIKENLLDIPDKHSKIFIVFGSERAGMSTLVACTQLGLQVKYVVDNNSKKWDKEILEWKIFSPDVLLKEDKKNLIIIVASQYYGDISYQLDQMGFVESIHYFYAFNANTKEERNYKEINGVKIGKYTYGYEQHCYSGSTLISIGSFCSINYMAQFVVNHPTNFISTHPFQYYEKCNGSELVPPIVGFSMTEDKSAMGIHSVTVGNDVWIGSNTIILPHIKIGNGAVIGAGAIVTKDVPDYAIVVGAPARVLRYRFNEQQIEILNRVQWWNWDDQTIVENAKYFTNMEAFFKKFG